MAKQFFEAYSWWKKPEAINYAKANGMDHYMKDGKLFLEVKYVPTKFEVEGVDVIYEGYQRLMNDWNGWEQPYFTEEVGKKVIADLIGIGEGEEAKGTDAQGYYAGSRFEDNKFIICRNDEDYEDEIVEQEIINVDGKDIPVYDFGLGWCWSEITPEIEQERAENKD